MIIDVDKFRNVLLHLRDKEAMLGREVIIDDLTSEESNFYCGLLNDEGLIEAKRFSDKHGAIYYPTRITLKGHNFLDGVTDVRDWETAKRTVGYVGTIISIVEIVKFVIESSTRS